MGFQQFILETVASALLNQTNSVRWQIPITSWTKNCKKNSKPLSIWILSFFWSWVTDGQSKLGKIRLFHFCFGPNWILEFCFFLTNPICEYQILKKHLKKWHKITIIWHYSKILEIFKLFKKVVILFLKQICWTDSTQFSVPKFQSECHFFK